MNKSPQPEGYARDGVVQDARGNWVKAWKKGKKNALV